MLAIQMKNVHVLYDKPAYIGFTVPELSKYKMYSFNHDYIKQNIHQNMLKIMFLIYH